MPSTENSVTTSLLLQLELLWFGSCWEKRQITEQVLRVWWKGMQVVLLELLSSSHDQWAHLEPSFLLQKKRIHDTICLGAPHAARGPYAHLPCGSGSHHGWLCPGTVWYSSCANLMTLSWRQHGWVSQHWVPGERPCPLARLFQWGWDGCTAAGSGMSTVGAVLEIPALCSRARHRHASCLLICKSALGWLAYWVGVGVSVWYFADSCNFILCCKLAGHHPAPSQEQVTRLNCAPC